MDSDMTARADAERLLTSGRYLPSIAAYESLVATGRASANDWYNLGYARHRVGRYGEALDAYGRALAAGAERPQDIHLERATLLAERMGQPLAARDALHEALAIDPDCVPAWVNLGNLEERLGGRAPAHAAYEQALSREADHPFALAKWSRLASIRGPDDPVIERLRAACTRWSHNVEAQMDLQFALGSAYDRAGAHALAFAALQAAHQGVRQLYERAGRLYSPSAVEGWVERQILGYPVQGETASPEPADAPPVFICGMFRSGTTLLEKILGAHPDVTAAGELELIPRIASRVGPNLPGWPLDGAGWCGWRDAYLRDLRRRHPSWTVITDKRPDNVLHLGLIKAMFPRARILHTRRAPLDNLLAIHFQHLATPYAGGLDEAVHWYIQYRRLMAHWERHFPQDILHVDYEHLVADPEEGVRRVLDFCGLPWHEGCLRFNEVDAVVATPSAWQVRQPLYTTSVGRWRAYAEWLAPAQAVLRRAGIDAGSAHQRP